MGKTLGDTVVISEENTVRLLFEFSGENNFRIMGKEVEIFEMSC